MRKVKYCQEGQEEPGEGGKGHQHQHTVVSDRKDGQGRAIDFALKNVSERF